MRLRTPLVLVLSGVAGLFWSFGSDVSMVVIHFIAPVVIAVLVVFLWRSKPWLRQLLLVLGFLLLAETVREIVYFMHGGWPYITDDLETQFWTVGSFAVQVVIGLLAFGAARLFILRHETPVA
jgi:hypothetical protein